MRQDMVDLVASCMGHFQSPCAVGHFRAYRVDRQKLFAEEALAVCDKFQGAYVKHNPTTRSWEFIQVGWVL